MKVKNIILVFAVMVGMVTANAGSADEHRSLATGCDGLRRGLCRKNPDCKWRSGECVVKVGQVGCRQLGMTQCLAARNCEWREVQIGMWRCRLGGTSTEPTTSTSAWHDTIDKIPQNIRDECTQLEIFFMADMTAGNSITAFFQMILIAATEFNLEYGSHNFSR
eukprot:scaffold19203_cov80-Skeletonema_menzelii.AAC.1